MPKNAIKDILENTTELPEALKAGIENEFNSRIETYLKEALNYDVNKPLELFVNDPDFKRLVLAWDRKNPDVTRAQLLRSFPAAFKDLQGNTIAEPIVDFFMDILKALVSDTALMQRLIRQMGKETDEMPQGDNENAELKESNSFKFIRVLIESKEEYLEKEKYVLDAGYEFAFFADERLMPVEPEEAKYKVFVKTVTVDTSVPPTPPVEEDEEEKLTAPSSESEEEEPVEESPEEDAEFSFVAKKMVALEWEPEYGGVGVEDEEMTKGEEEEEEEEEIPEEDEMPEEEFVDKVNEYLDYTINEFIKENRVAIENSYKVELAESLIKGVRTVLEQNSLEVNPETNKKIVELEEKLKRNDEALNTLYEKNVELFKENKRIKKELFEQKRNNIYNELLSESTISDVQRDNIKKLFDLVKFNGNESEDEIRQRLNEVKKVSLIETRSNKDTSPTATKLKTLMEFSGTPVVESKEKKEKDIDVINSILKNLK